MREKLKEQRRKKFKKFFLVFLVLAGIFLIVFLKITVPGYLRQMSLFQIKKIVVEPENYQDFISTYLGGYISKNILFLELNPIYTSLEGLSFVEDCTVEKQMPDVLLVRLKLRIPWIRIDSGTSPVLMDRKGYFLPFDEKFKGWTVKGIRPGHAGEKVSEEDTEKIKILSEIERWYNHYDMGSLYPVDGISLENMENIEISGQNGTVFLYPENIEKKFEQLMVVLKECKEENRAVEYINIRFDQPYVKYKEENTK